MHNLLALTDRAIAAYLTDQGVAASAAVYPFKRSLGKELPCVVVQSGTASPLSPFGATCEVTVEIHVRSIASIDEPEQDEDPIDANDELVDLVSQALHKFGDGAQSGADIAAAITTSANGAGDSSFTCQNVDLVSFSSTIENPKGGGSIDAWTDTYTLRVIACPSDVS